MLHKLFFERMHDYFWGCLIQNQEQRVCDQEFDGVTL